MLRDLVLSGLCVAGILFPAGNLADQGKAGEDEPLEVDLQERTGRRLVQFDVSVDGPTEAISNLTAADFELVVGGRTIESFVADRACGTDEPEAMRVAEDPAVPRGDAPQIVRPVVRYLFYFDQVHLTFAGRQRGLDVARQLVKRLIPETGEAMIVSSADQVQTFSAFTDDVDDLLRAIDDLEHSREQWSMHAAQEDDRVAEIVQMIDDTSYLRKSASYAKAMALRIQQEEIWATEKALRRFKMVLGAFANLDPPKAVVYFADRMRSRPGQHYTYMFSTAKHMGEFGDPSVSRMDLASFSAANSYERVIDEASAHGVRLYTVQAEGLVMAHSYGSPRNTRFAPGSHPAPYMRRLRDAQDSLVGFALETGGQAFLNGVSAAKIARAIRSDLSCAYVISFDASLLPTDRSLRLLLRVKRPGVKARARGRLFVQSESKRLTAQLMAAFAAPGTVESESPLRLMVIPTDFRDGRYRALVQATAQGSPLPGAIWDIGVSLLSRDKVVDDAAARTSIPGPGVAIVFEAEMDFRPGPYEIVAVAHESTGGEVVSGTLEGLWPKPVDSGVTVGPLAVVQPAEAVFLRESGSRVSGSRGLAPGEMAAVERPVALIGLVCASSSRRNTVRIDRRLIGESAVDFQPIEVDPGEIRCAQIRDVIPADTLTEGSYRYEVRAWSGDRELANAAHVFHVAAP